MNDYAVEPAGSKTVKWERRDALHLYASQIGEIRMISVEEEKELAARLKRGERAAFNTMVEANLRLVVKIARGFENQGLTLLELISEGNIGLMEGVRRFNPAKGSKFSSYAAWWIRKMIKKALSEKHMIHLSVHMTSKIFRMNRVAMRLHGELGREPDDQELAQELGISMRSLRNTYNCILPIVHLQSVIGDDGEGMLEDVIADENAIDPATALSNKTKLMELKRLLKKLDDRQRKILKLRYGFQGSEWTLQEIGDTFSVTKERARQIEKLALRKMRKMFERLDRIRVGSKSRKRSK